MGFATTTIGRAFASALPFALLVSGSPDARATTACSPAALVADINAANAAGGGTISLTAGCHYLFADGSAGGGGTALPVLRGAITIQGNGAFLRRDHSQDGSGAGDVASFRLIEVHQTAIVEIANLSIRGGRATRGGTGSDAETFKTATSGGPGANGGGILNFGTLLLNRVTMSWNTAGWGGTGGQCRDGFAVVSKAGGNGGPAGSGGAIWNAGTLTIVDGVLRQNTAGEGGWGGGCTGSSEAHGGNGGGAGHGGAVFNQSGGTALIRRSTVVDNRSGIPGMPGCGPANDCGVHGAPSAGGGIASFGTLAIEDSTIEYNEADGDNGGGVSAGGGTLAVRRSTIRQNWISPHSRSTKTRGGGLYVNVPATLDNTTIAFNHAIRGAGISCALGGDGGGIYADSNAVVTLRNGTLSTNVWVGYCDGSERAGMGGAIYNRGTVRLSNTILNFKWPQEAIPISPLGNINCAGPGSYVDLTPGHNIASMQTGITLNDQVDQCPPTVLGDETLHDPRLDPVEPPHGIGEYRDPSLGPDTRAPGSGSAAFGAGDNATCLATDARGVARPQEARCDIGAHETRVVLVSHPSDITVVVPVVKVANALPPVARFQASLDTDGFGPPTVQWQTSPDGTNWSDIAGATSVDEPDSGSTYVSTYNRFPIEASDQFKRFRAVFRSAAKSAALTTNAAKLTVHYGPVITRDFPEAIGVNVGSTFNLTFGFSAYPGVGTVQWQVSTDSGATWSNLILPYNGGVGATVTIPQLATPAMYNALPYWRYRVRLSPAYPGGPSIDSTVTTVFVTNNTSGPKITEQFYLPPVNEGQEFVATVNVTGNPVPSIGWQMSSDGGATWEDLANGGEYRFDTVPSAQGQGELRFINWAYHDGRMIRPVVGGDVLGHARTMYVVIPTLTTVDCPTGARVGTDYPCMITVAATPLNGPFNRIPKGRILVSGATLDPPLLDCATATQGCCLLDDAGRCPVTFQSDGPVGTVRTIYADYSVDTSVDGWPVDQPSFGSDDVLTTNCDAPVITQCAPPQVVEAFDQCSVPMPDFAAATQVNSAGCEASLVTSQDVDAGLGIHPGELGVTITARNAAGSATCSTKLTVFAGTEFAFNGSNPTMLECGGAPYEELGAIATTGPAVCGNEIASASGTVDTAVVGIYPITYQAADFLGNPITAIREVHVRDTLPPEISLYGAAEMVHECGLEFFDPGANAHDQCVGDEPAPGNGVVDTHTPGAYTRTYTADLGGAGTPVQRLVRVEDTVGPELHCPGVITLFAAQGAMSAEVPFGVGVFDQCDGPAPLTTSVPTGSRFPLGSSLVQATARDRANNPGACAFQVVVNETPTSLMIGPSVALNASTAGQPYAVPVQIHSDNSVAPTGNIVVSDGTTQCTIALPATQCSLVSGTAGTKTITATYAGDPIHGGSDTSGSHEVEEGVVCTAPVIDTCAPAQSVDAGAACAAPMPDFTATTAASATPGCEATLTQDVAPGTSIALGTTPVSITAGNSSGSVACASSFTVTSSTAPTLTLNGLAEITLECGSSYEEAGASAIAACDGGSVAVTTTGSVDSTTPGDYTITYSAGSASATRTVHVRDTQAPVIALTGSDPLALTCPSASGDPGAVAHDACAGDFAATATGAFDPLAAGSYTLTYNASDPSGNAALPVTRQVHVTDTTKPVISLNGANPATVECRGTYTDAGGSANDACAGPLSLSSSGTVDTNTPGPYQIGYSATDPSQNTGTASRAVNVVDTTNPSIACPADISVQATPGTCAANVPFSVTGGDTCDANPTLALSHAAGSSFAVGTTLVSATNTDHGGNSVGCGFNVTVTNTATAVALSLSHPTQQYSDAETLTAVVTDTQTNAPVAGGTVTFKIGGSTVGTIAVGANGVATLALNLVESALLAKADLSPGAHTVTATYNGVACFGTATDSETLTVTAEDARVAYTGPNWAPACSSTSATVTFSANVKDITAVDPALSPPNPDNAAGRIANATLKFVNRDTNAVLCTAPVGLIDPLDAKSGTAACTANLATGDYHVGLIVGGYYVRDDADEDNQVLEVATSCGTGSISGGGYLVLATPAGAFAGDVGSKNNFGFNVKYNKPKTALQGSINTIVRKAGRLYQVKGNAMTSLVVDDKITASHPYPTATFFGKANLIDVTDPLNPVALPNGGGALLKVTMTNRSEAAKSPLPDTLGITVWYGSSGGGGLFYSSNWDGANTREQPLGGTGGGNVDVR